MIFVFFFFTKVNSHYLELQGALWNTSRYPYFDISNLRNWGKQLIEQPPLTEWICNLTPVWDIFKILWKREIASKEQFLLFSTIFCCLLVDLCVKTGTRFSLRDKRLFEISEFDKTRVDCIYGQGCYLANINIPLIKGLMWNLVKIGQAVSEKKFKDYTILYMYIAQGQGWITTMGQNFDCN